MELVLDTTKHPFDPASILDWALTQWDEDGRAGLVIITSKGDGDAMDGRIRVKLSLARKKLRDAKATGMKEFGIESQIIPWTLADGTELEALCITRKLHARHTMMEAFDSIFNGEQK